MAGIYTFRTSRLALWALWLSRLAIPVALLSFLMMRFGDLHPSIAIYCFASSVALALLSLLVGGAAFPSIWIEGYKGGRRLWGTLLRSLLILLPALILVYLYFSRPVHSDLSTSPLDPPEFVFAQSERDMRDNDLNIPSLAIREQQAFAYPELKSLQVERPVDLLHLMVKDALEAENWTITRESALSQTGDDSLFEASIRSVITGLRYVIAVRLRDNGEEGTIIDLRSASVWGDHDLGLNASRITGFQASLNQMLEQSVARYQLRLEELERKRRLERGPVPLAKPKRRRT